MTHNPVWIEPTASGPARLLHAGGRQVDALRLRRHDTAGTLDLASRNLSHKPDARSKVRASIASGHATGAAGEAATEGACRGVRGAKPLG